MYLPRRWGEVGCVWCRSWLQRLVPEVSSCSDPVGPQMPVRAVNVQHAITSLNKYQLMFDTGPGRGMRWDEAPTFVCEKQGCRPTTPDAPSQGRMKWNETRWMRWVWENGGTKFVAGENGRNPEKNLPRFRFVHTEWPRRELGTPEVGGEQLIACATRSPL